MSQRFYLVAAIVGAVAPYIFFVGFFADEGLGLGAFLDAAFVNGVAAGFTVDVVISSAVFWWWMRTRRDGPNPLPFMAVNMLIGLSCAFPLYLWQSSRKRAAERTPAG